MKILIAGGAGYIGTSLCEYLNSKNYKVEVVDLLWFGNHLSPNIKVFKKDLFLVNHKYLSYFDQLIFAAGISNDPMAEYDPAQNFIYNSALPIYLAYQAKKAKVKRFIFSSSCSIYQNSGNKLFDENRKVNPTYPYAISKLIAEKGLMTLVDKNFSAVILRLGTVCGVSKRMRFDLAGNTMFKTAITEGKIYVNNPSTWRPIIDIRDACLAFHRAIVSPYSVNGVFNIAGGNYQTIKLARLVKKEIDIYSRKNIQLIIKKNREKRNYKVSTVKAKKILNFIPKIRIGETVRRLYNNRLSFGNYDQDKYYNITIFKKLRFINKSDNGI